MVKLIVVNDKTILLLCAGKTIVINEDTIFITDKTIVNLIFSDKTEEETLISLEYFFAYLDFLNVGKENRQIVILSNLYKDIGGKIEKYPESKEYFFGHIQSSKKFLGEQTNEDKDEVLALIQYLVKKYPTVIFVSEEYNYDDEFISRLPKRSIVLGLEELSESLKKIPSFYDYVYKKYFESSA